MLMRDDAAILTFSPPYIVVFPLERLHWDPHLNRTPGEPSPGFASLDG